MEAGGNGRFGSRRIYYNNFAEHLQNAYNPNMFYPGMPNRWSDADWRGCIDFIAACGFNVFEFWFVPRLFCREALNADYAREFTRQMNAAIDYAHGRGVKSMFLCSLATVGDDWRTCCPNDPGDWAEIQFLWDAWLERFPGIDIVDIFPGDPGACSRNGCTAETYIDRSLDIAHIVRRRLPQAEIEFNTWGPPFFGWGNIQGPLGWKGEFIQEYQHSAWKFDLRRAEKSMSHLLRRLPEFPDPTSVALNMGFNPDSNPSGEQDARQWVREIARTNKVYTWDFSLTEGENAVIPHWRFDRLFQRRREERAGAPYSGGICFTMTPRLNQLTLFMAAQSFIHPDADPDAVAGEFLEGVFGPGGRELVQLLPLFEVVRDWGNYRDIHLSRTEYHAKMRQMSELLESLAGNERDTYPVFPSPSAWRKELLFFAGLFADLCASLPDYDILHERYWRHVYAIYDQLPEHVDPRPRNATAALIRHFINFDRMPDAEAIPGKWL
ncbi:MAG: hypothetical protein WC637_03885 [Victivallales bacterium]|jgi:hypothetical protein